MSKKCLLLPALLLSMAAGAQTVRTATSLVYTRLTGYSTQCNDAFSFGGNLGALAASKSFAAGVYSERRFLLSDLSSYAATVVVPTGSGNFGLRGDYAGGHLYNESSAGLAYGRNLGNKLSVGVQFNYFNLSMQGYGAASTVSVDAGAVLHLSPQLNTGLQVYNPVGARWGKDGLERLPAVYTAGIGYDVSPQVFIGAEAEKTEDQPTSINAALNYVFAEKLMARVGVRSAASVLFMGVGVQLKTFRVDATASVHPFLGLTPGLLLLYSPGK